MQRFFCALFLLFSCGVLSAQARPPQDKPAEIHEAFVVPAKATPLLNATLKEPPERIVERIPPNDDPKAEWIPGYWEWNEKQGDFSWICGVWRRPPPGMVWNPGFWKKFPEGWVRIVGFWHNQPAQNIRAVKAPPPAPIDEQVQAPPGKDFFWAPGFWQFSHVDNRYGWVPGRWEPLDQSFVLS
ncbi:MAG: YXWGXW repeat-containing protein, partial [Chlamydiia bacterium]|nr:YXWGXW repeat-containing protein [Chlamydiia bacterium]